MIPLHRYVAPFLVSLAAVSAAAAPQQKPVPSGGGFESLISSNALAMIEEGRQTFRYDTFGDEAFWSDALKLHYHDGRFATPNDVVNYYNKHWSLGLTDEQSRDLVKYLKSL